MTGKIENGRYVENDANNYSNQVKPPLSPAQAFYSDCPNIFNFASASGHVVVIASCICLRVVENCYNYFLNVVLNISNCLRPGVCSAW